MSNEKRLKIFSKISSKLSCLSDVELEKKISEAESLHKGINSNSALLMLNGTRVFIKKIPLTKIELMPENIMSTRNIFNLPLFYQYGVGSTGFGAWRELVSHILTTNYIVGDLSSNFPLLYHWRLLPSLQSPISDEQLKALNHDVEYWEGSSAIRQRLEALLNSEFHIVLFLEYIPYNLHDWVKKQVGEGHAEAESAIQLITNSLDSINKFTKQQKLIHFDAHFRNILTDGKQIYFGDFGLCLSKHFELQADEIEFFGLHSDYDKYSTAVNLMHCILTSYYGKKSWPDILYSDDLEKLPQTIAATVEQYKETAKIMHSFFSQLQDHSKLTSYPAENLKVK